MAAVPDIRLEVPAAPPPSPVPGNEHHELWFSIAPRQWRSLVLVPCHASGSTVELAHALAEVGRRLHGPPVIAIDAAPLDYDGAAMVSAVLTRRDDDTRRIVSIPPVTVEPLGVAIAQAADGVVLGVELGKSLLPIARRTIELIGRERIVGAFVLR